MAKGDWRRRQAEVFKTGQVHFQDAASVSIPDHVEQTRQHRAALRPRNITAAHCGDPLPGFSALDQKNKVAIGA